METKIGVGQRLKEFFTKKGAEQKWLREHDEMIKMYADVQNGLTPEQRQQVMEDIAKDAKDAAKIQVRNHWIGLGATLLVLAGVGLGIAKPDLIGKIKNIKIPLGRGEGAKAISFTKVGEAMENAAQHAHDFLWDIPDTARKWSGKIAGEVRKMPHSFREAWKSTFPKKAVA